MNQAERQASEARVGIARAHGSMKAIVVSALLVVILVACGGSRTTPPGPNSVGGTVADQANYLLLDWQEGLRILIWDDIARGNLGSGSASSSSSSGTGDPVFYLEGSAQSADGRSYEYSLEAIDGQQADFAIDGISYDLRHGKLFLIRTWGGTTEVEQLDLDLSGLSPTAEGVVAFGQQTAEIAAFMAASTE